jgi:hypothetical protein
MNLVFKGNIGRYDLSHDVTSCVKGSSWETKPIYHTFLQNMLIIKICYKYFAAERVEFYELISQFLTDINPVINS